MKKFFFAAGLLLAAATVAQAETPQTGYRGFVDVDYNWGKVSSFGKESQSTNFMGYSTIHGYQINPNLFVGGGFMYSQEIAPLYVDVRTDQKWGNFTPFADLRLGHSLSGTGTYYMAPSVGYRFSLCEKLALNLSVGATFRGWLDNKDEVSAGLFSTKQKFNTLGFIRVGFDF